MIGNDLDDVAFAGAGRTDGAVTEIAVVYLDSDATTRQRVQAALSEHSAEMTVTCVGTTDAALEAAASTEVSCLVLDPTGLDEIPAPLVSNDRYPVVLYTDATAPDSAATPFDDAETVVKKQDAGEQVTFLAEKVVSLVSASVDRSETALRDALSGIESRADVDELAVLLADDGTVQWSSEAVSAFVDGIDDTSSVEGFYEAMAAALPDTPGGRRQLQRLRESPTEPGAVRVPPHQQEAPGFAVRVPGVGRRHQGAAYPLRRGGSALAVLALVPHPLPVEDESGPSGAAGPLPTPPLRQGQAGQLGQGGAVTGVTGGG